MSNVRRLRNDELYHHGIKGQRWGIRRYQNPDGSYTEAGRNHYGRGEKTDTKPMDKEKIRKKADEWNTVYKNTHNPKKVASVIVQAGAINTASQVIKDGIVHKGFTVDSVSRSVGRGLALNAIASAAVIPTMAVVSKCRKKYWDTKLAEIGG